MDRRKAEQQVKSREHTARFAEFSPRPIEPVFHFIPLAGVEPLHLKC